jgi:hypothetical protein
MKYLGILTGLLLIVTGFDEATGEGAISPCVKVELPVEKIQEDMAARYTCAELESFGGGTYSFTCEKGSQSFFIAITPTYQMCHQALRILKGPGTDPQELKVSN